MHQRKMMLQHACADMCLQKDSWRLLLRAKVKLLEYDAILPKFRFQSLKAM